VGASIPLTRFHIAKAGIPSNEAGKSRPLRLFSILLLLHAAHAFGMALPERLIVHGTVSDVSTHEPLPAAHVRIAGSARGTITSPSGEYTLQLDAGTYTFIASMIGYRPETTLVVLSATTVVNHRLQSIDIVLPEVVVTNEDPAVEIIRRAIARKRQWINSLASYQMEAFTRQVLRRDTAIASVTESFTRGYWQQGDTLREVVLQRRQTANIPQSFNFASVGRIINFNDDEVRFFGFAFVGPTAPSALDEYEVHLKRTFRDRGGNVFEIALTPRRRTTPLFRGTIHIADESYALMGVDVEPNEAFQIPFVKEKHLRYRQQFALYQNEIWLPIDIRITADAAIGMVGISFPRFGFEQTSVITDYTINPQLPDSVFHKARLVIDSSAVRTDTTFWASHEVLPLTSEETTAYKSLDSTQSLDVQFKPGSITLQLSDGGSATGTLLKYADVSFTRVDGLNLGAQYNETVMPILDVHTGFTYAFARKGGSYSIGGTLFSSESRIIGIGADGYRKSARRPEAGYFGSLVNTFTTLLHKNDYPDYYLVEGWQTSLVVAPSNRFRASFGFVNEVHTSLPVASEYSFFYRSRNFRPNDAIAEGKMRSLVLSMRYGEAPAPLNLVSRNVLELSIEYSSPQFAGSSFDFTRLEANGTLVVPTSSGSALMNPGFTFKVAVGMSGGTIPLQRAFMLESASSSMGPFGVMRAMEVKEFGGTEYVACNVEHNFRSLPFLALGIPFLYERSIEFIIHAGTARAWNRSALPVRDSGGWYSEAGFGVNRLLDLLRADCTWRFTNPTGFRFTLSVAQIL
jgi:hypothetical protein